VSASQLVVSCSLSPVSRSAVLAEQLARDIEAIGDDVAFVDLRELELPLCDDDTCYRHPNVATLRERIGRADAVAIATPIYNYEVGGATRNLIALGGSAFRDKVVGFLCAAGGQRSYMSVMTLANSLMLDFRSVIVPRFVYATGGAFEGDAVKDAAISERLRELAESLHRFGTRLREP
jgi:FMN reductase